MFHKEIEEQSELGSAFLEYQQAEILKIFLLGTNDGAAFVGAMCVVVCPKKNSRYVTASFQTDVALPFIG